MKISTFTISNYRSIATAYKLPLSNYSVIVGPNNEGKSNILKGLAFALSILSGSRGVMRFRRTEYLSFKVRRRTANFDYEWIKDFPLSLQKTNPNGKTEFVLEFELNTDDQLEFNKKVKVNLTTNLKAKVSIGKEDYNIEFLLKGRGKASLNKKKNEILDFINRQLQLQYIPAIRTSELSIDIVENLLSKELSTLEQNPDFKKLLQEIQKFQKPILDKISKNVATTISGFIPDVKSIKIESRERISNILSAACRVYVNDGIETDLQAKGDGIISLTAISLLKHISQQSGIDKGQLLLLEEPESHLHPKAIHRLKSVLSDISKTNQVIITTHSPIIVEKGTINQNIIVQKSKAIPAKSLAEIRDCLGIHMSDNLTSAYLVLLLEGADDKLILNHWLQLKSKALKEALAKGILIIDHLGGATNISYKASLYKSNLCNVYAYLDNDPTGRKALQDSLDKDILKNNEYTLCSCHGMTDSEIEDLLNLDNYRQHLIDTFGVDLNIKPFKSAKNAWSERVKEVFRLNGKLWNDKIELQVKETVAKHITTLGLEVISTHKGQTIDSLITNLETILAQK